MKKKKTLQQKVRRRDRKIDSLKSLLDDLVKKQLLTEDVSANLEKSFSGFPLEFFKNHLQNENRKARG